MKKSLPVISSSGSGIVTMASSSNHFFSNQQDEQQQQQKQHQMLFDEFFHNSLVFNGINRPTPMLDNGPAKFKSSLIKRGSLASRQLPLQQQQQIQNNSQFSNKKSLPDQER